MSNSILIPTLLILSVVLIDATPWVAEPRDANWIKKHEHLLNMTHAHAHEIKVVFLGDSITEAWANNGHKVWDEHYKPRHAYNYGIGGDRTEHVLWRIEKGEFEKVNPKVIVLMIGTNNISKKDSAADIAKGVKAILELLHKKMPNAKVLLLSVFPRGGAADIEVHKINKDISKYDDQKKVFYLDFTSHFEKGLSNVLSELYVSDHLHLSPAGYEVWYKEMENLFSKLLK